MFSLARYGTKVQEVQMPDLKDVERNLIGLLKELTLKTLIGKIGNDKFGRYLRVFIDSVAVAISKYQRAREGLTIEPQTDLVGHIFGFVTNFEISVIFARRAFRLFENIKGKLREKPELGKRIKDLRRQIEAKSSKIIDFRDCIIHVDELIRCSSSGPVLPIPTDGGKKIKLGNLELSTEEYSAFLKNLGEITISLLRS